VLFTTGRGTPFGTFVPTMKISTNSGLYARKPHWIDFNAGSLVEGKSMEDLFREFARAVIDVANGSPTCNERKGYQEFAIFKNGVTL
jgi:altronate hydrolase